MTNRIARTALAATLALAGFVAAPTAHACGGGWWPEENVDYRIHGVAQAEKQLDKGNYEAAAGAVIRMIPHIKNYKGTSKDPIVRRALRVLAVATARTNGKLALKRELPFYLQGSWLGKDGAAQQTNLKWAVATLSKAAEDKKDDVVLEGDLALAMARTEGQKAEGIKRLEALAQKDLLTSPEAYAELAKVRAAKGDGDGRTAAIQRCKAMSDVADVCRVQG
jgi:hypothetical protein